MTTINLSLTVFTIQTIFNFKRHVIVRNVENLTKITKNPMKSTFHLCYSKMKCRKMKHVSKCVHLGHYST